MSNKEDSIINVGVIGLGEQGWDNLLPSLAVIKNANIKAVCDIDKRRSMTAARNYGATPYFDYSQMIEAEHLDAVVIASHPSVHSLVLENTIIKKIPTFVEKPPTLYTEGLKKLVELNQKFNTISAVGLNFSFTEPIQALKRIIQKPAFGKIEYLRVAHYGNKPSGTMWGIESKSRSFLLSQAIHPMGLLFDLGTFTPDCNRTIRSHVNESGLLFDVNMQLAGDDGHLFTAELLTCSTSPFFEWQLQIISDKGVMININSLWEMEIYSTRKSNSIIDNQKWWRDTWRPSPLSGGFKRNGYEYQFEAFFKSISEGNNNGLCLEKMLPIYDLIDEMEKSCNE